MPYKDLEKQKAARHKHYVENRLAYVDRHRIAKQKKQEYIKAAKAKPCTDCGKEFPFYVMDLDHTRGSKIMQVSRMKDCTIEKIQEEIAKCDVVCSNCYRIRTYERKQYQRSIK